MCGITVDIQSAMAENRRGKKESGSQSGGHQAEARRAEVRAEFLKARMAEMERGFVGGDVLPLHQLRIMGSAVNSPRGVRSTPRRPIDFRGCWYSGTHSR